MKTIKPILIAISIILILVACGRKKRNVNDLEQQVSILTHELDSLRASIHELDSNKIIVANMYQEIFGDKNVSAADKYIHPDYIQHNPMVADGRQALKDALSVWFQGAPKEQIDIRFIGADSTFVFLHTKSGRGDTLYSVMDIFRLENDTIMEHWDVIQEVPKESANTHPMF